MTTTTSTANESTGLIKGAGIVSLVLAFIAPWIGLVTSIAVYFWARSAGASTKLGIAGIIISLIMLVVALIAFLAITSLLTSAVMAGAINMDALCAQRDSWGWLIDSLRYVCR